MKYKVLFFLNVIVSVFLTIIGVVLLQFTEKQALGWVCMSIVGVLCAVGGYLFEKIEGDGM